MHKAFAVVALLIVPLAAGAAPKKRATLVDGIVATVGERCIMLSDVRKRVATLPEGQRTSKTLETELQEMVDEQLVESDIERARLAADSREIDERIASDAKKLGMTDSQFLESVEKRGIQRTEHREATAKAIVAEKWDRLVVGPRLKPGEDMVAGRARRVRELRASYDVDVFL